MPTYAQDIMTAMISGRTLPDGVVMKEIHPKIKYFEDAKVIGRSLFAMQGKEVGRKPTINPKTFVYEKEPQSEWLQLNGAINDAVTTITVDDVGPLKIGDVVQLWTTDLATCEQMLVLTVPTSTTFTVTRAYGSSSAAAWDDDSKVKIQFNASTEDSTLPTIMNVIPSEEWNCVTILRTPLGGSLLFVNTKTYTGDPMTDQKIEKWINHLNQKVNNALFGERKFDTTGGRPIGEGIIPAILRRGGVHVPIGGLLGFDKFLETMDDMFRTGSQRKLGIFSPMLMRCLSYWKRQELVVMNEDEYLNMRVVKVDLQGGNELIVIPERKLAGDSTNYSALFGSAGLVLDPANITYQPFLNYDEKLLMNRQANDALMEKSEYLSIFLFRYDVITSHGLITGVTGPTT